MRVLLLGGTGAIGMHLLQLLSDKNIEVVVTSRKFRHSDGNVKYLQGDAHNMEFLQTTLSESWDAIVDFMVYSMCGFRDCINLLLNATSQYVFLSSGRVYADSDQPIKETSPRLLEVSHDKEYLSTDDYALTKALQENVLKDSGYKNWTIIRPYITYGENRMQLGVLEKEEWLYRALHGRTIVFSEDINSKVTTLTYGMDVSIGIASTIGNQDALAQTFHITTEDAIQWSEVLDVYMIVLEKHLGYRPRVLMEKLDQFVGICPARYQVVYDRLFNRQFDNSKISQFVNANNFIGIKEGIEGCLKTFLKNPKFKNINWKAEALKDRRTNEHIPLNEIQGVKQKLRYIIYRYLVTHHPLKFNIK